MPVIAMQKIQPNFVSYSRLQLFDIACHFSFVSVYIIISDKIYTMPKVVNPINNVAMVYTCNIERISSPENFAITQK